MDSALKCLSDATPAEMVAELVDRTNPFGFNPCEEAGQCANAFHSRHRTLQQNFTRFLTQFIKAVGEHQWAETTDLRNEAAIEWYKEVTKVPVALPHV